MRVGRTFFLVENGAINYGGAIHCLCGSPCIVGNVISSNTSSGGGGGISLSATYGSVVSGNTISANKATGCNAQWDSAEGGGGVLILAGADSVFDNLISSNAATYGGGIYAMASFVQADRNVIISNNRPNPGWWSSGGGVAAASSSLVMRNNFVCDNEAYEGGGISCYTTRDYGPTSISLSNNTIAGNTALNRRGGGVFSDGSSFAAISNSILWFNGQDLYNCGATFSCFESASETDGKNNIAKYPYFLDPESGEYHLKSYSACIQAGRNSVVPAGSVDIDYDPRILFGTVDMGADEVAAISEDTDEDGLPDDWEIEHFGPLLPAGHELDEDGEGDYDEDGLTNLQEFVLGTNPTFDATVIHVDDDASGLQDGSTDHPFDAIQKGVNRTRGTVCVAGGTYDEEVVVRGKSIEIRGGYNADFEVCDPETYPSTVRASHASPVITGRAFTFDDAPSGLLTGFVITGGNATVGGGILCRASSPTITENAILENMATVGGGIHLCEGSSATITTNSLDSNAARDGGAVACVQSAARIENNVIGSNSPNAADRCGGGIYCLESGGAIVAGNEICSNVARFQGGGLAFYKCEFPLPASASEAPVRANVIKDNRAAIGGGLAFEYCLNPTMVWNIVAGNIALEGGGIFLSFTAGAGTIGMPVADIENNTIADNEAADLF